jgi:hypothetical protein
MPNPSADGKSRDKIEGFDFGHWSLDTCEPRQSEPVQSSVEGWRSKSGNSNLSSEICNPKSTTLAPLQEIICVIIMNVERKASDMRASR